MLNRTMARAGQLDRISLNFTVPENIASKVWRHLLASIKQFEKAQNIEVIDLDMQSAPIDSIVGDMWQDV